MNLPIRVLIAHSHPVVRLGLRSLLEHNIEFEVVGEAGDGADAVHLAKQLRPDVVLMGLQMPVMDGITATASIRCDTPDVAVVIKTSERNYASAAAAIRAGAISYLQMSTPSEELYRTIKAAATGQARLSPDLQSQLLRELWIPNVLTQREMEVLRLVAQGQANEEISRNLYIIEQAVERHVYNIGSAPFLMMQAERRSLGNSRVNYK